MFIGSIRTYLVVCAVAGVAVASGALQSCATTTGPTGVAGDFTGSTSGAGGAVAGSAASASTGDPSSGSASGGGPATGSASGAPSGSQSGSSGVGSGSSSAGSRTGSRDASASSADSSSGLDCSGDKPPNCGAQAGAQVCDLRSNTCCSDANLNGKCVPGASATCPASMATAFHCLQACDCPTGEVCCGVATKTSVQTVCQALPNGGSCTPADNANQGSAQICVVDAECKNGQNCTQQTCTLGVQLKLCGIQSGPPFMCM